MVHRRSTVRCRSVLPTRCSPWCFRSRDGCTPRPALATRPGPGRRSLGTPRWARSRPTKPSASRSPGSSPRRWTCASWPIWSSSRPAATSTGPHGSRARHRLPRPHPRRRGAAACRPTPAGTPSSALPEMAFDHASIAGSGVRRLRAKLSYTNLGFALAPASSPPLSCRRSTRPHSGTTFDATNLRRILVRREQIEETGSTASPGRHGGRPGRAVPLSGTPHQVTDQFAVLRPPDSPRTLTG